MKAPIYNHYGKIVNGKYVFYNPALHQKSLEMLEGKEFVLVLKEKFKKTSLDTHGYYRGGIILECMKYEMFGGWNEDEIHDFFAGMFLTYKKIKTLKLPDGKISAKEITNTISTGSLSQKEMNVFIESVIHWLANQGIVIHTPEEYYLGKYKTITDEKHTED